MAAVSERGPAARGGAVRVGLEIHARLTTRSKLFCGCANDPAAPPNRAICPVCAGLPGSLPAVNAAAVRQAVRIALALGARVATVSRFDRKHYFYPDLPRNYQITQYERPLATGGVVTLADGSRVPLERMHLEEDAARVRVPAGGGGPWSIDLNRAGTPLIELVTAPVLGSGASAAATVAAVRRLLIHLAAGDGHLETGGLRCDVNVSLAGAPDPAASRVEIKNLNSLQAIARAVAYESVRQAGAANRGAGLTRETRSWDPIAGVTVPLRDKEAVRDYLYLPEPDLPPLELAAADVARLAGELPELPVARERRFRRELGLTAEAARVLVETPERADRFEAVAARLGDPRVAARWLRGEWLAALRAAGLSETDALPSHAELAELLVLLRDGTLSETSARAVLAEMLAGGGRAAAIVERRRLHRIDEPATLERWIEDVLAEHPREVARYREGKRALLDYFVGRVLARSDGRAEPREIRDRLRARLDPDVTS
jgi:aspartyl-tRNA(Asn)/glutamyl-tRNA(Gln) amidotransferase subunit B